MPKKRIEYTETELRWLKNILSERMDVIGSRRTHIVANSGSNSQLAQLANLQYSNEKSLLTKVNNKLDKKATKKNK